MNWLFFILIHLNCYTDILILACLTQVVDFNIHVTESGEEYNETIEVDTQKQTEVFKVPAHPGVDRSDVMHDFKQVIIVGYYMLHPFATWPCCILLRVVGSLVAPSLKPVKLSAELYLASVRSGEP